MNAPISRVEVRDERDVVLARQRARAVAARLGFEAQDQARIAAAVSEVARNAVQHAGSGLVEFLVELEADPGRSLVARAPAPGPGHSADTWASMYYAYNGVKQSPDNDDIAGIQAVWGTRPEDGLAQGWTNYVGSSHAANINPFMNTNNNQIYLPNQDIANPGESYWFKFTTPSNANSLPRRA